MSKKLLSAIARHICSIALCVALSPFAAAATPPDVAAPASVSGGESPETDTEIESPETDSEVESPETDSDGDLLPDIRDPQPLVANVPVYWSVQKFTLSRPVANPPANGIADTSWSSAPTLDIAAVLHAPTATSTLTSMPLPTRRPVVNLKVHPFAPLAVFGVDAIRFGVLERARVAAFLRGWRADGADSPVTLTFTVHFANLASEQWEFPHLEVPVTLDGRRWCKARVVPQKPQDHGFALPVGDKMVKQDFVAELDAGSAAAFLSRLSTSQATPSFDFTQATWGDPESTTPPQLGEYSLTSAYKSILHRTRQVRIEGPDGLVWTWRVASVDLSSGAAVTFGQWVAGINDISRNVYGAPLFAFDGTYPISVAGWDNGCWDLYWAASRKGREIDLETIESQRLNADMVVALSTTPPAKLPPEGSTPVLLHLRGIWQHHNGFENEAVESFYEAGRNGAPQGYSWYGHSKALIPDDPNSPGANKKEALNSYKLAAADNYAPGLAWHGRALVHGEGIAANKEAGVAELKKAADQGFAEGRLLYAMFLMKGVGVKANPNEALVLLTQAAWQGNRPAMAALGDFLLESGSLEGRDWIELAANNGDDKAAARLARFFRVGELGTAVDSEAAAKWLQRAADAGDATSLVYLGEALRSGSGVRRNPKKAAEYFRRAADAGSGEGMTWYALCLLEGNGVRRDVPKALDLLSRAADAGNANAKFFHGVCLFGGYGGTEPDKPAAMLRFRDAAAEQPAASVFLGVGYLNGLGLKKDEKKAVECFKAAADRDFPAGILWLAHCHANGIGVEKNLEEARKWARKAANLGIPAGRQMLLSIQE